jgi:hypothetical protein
MSSVFFAATVAWLAACEPDHDWPRQCPNPHDPEVQYMHETWAQRGDCQAIDFACPDGEYLHARFPNRMQEHDCGCGCYGASFDDAP